MADKPKIYVFVNSRWADGDLVSAAVAEDGTFLASHVSSNVQFARGDMGLHEKHAWSKKREGYEKHYPDGYELVDLLEVDPRSNPGCAAMLDAAWAKSRTEESVELSVLHSHSNSQAEEG